jgi:hypothetical protein
MLQQHLGIGAAHDTLLPKFVDQCVQGCGGQGTVHHAVDQDSRGPIAIADTAHRQQGEQPVAGGLAHFDAQPLLQVGRQIFAAFHPADQAVADMDDIFAHRFSVDKRVKGGQFLNLQRGHGQ